MESNNLSPKRFLCCRFSWNIFWHRKKSCVRDNRPAWPPPPHPTLSHYVKVASHEMSRLLYLILRIQNVSSFSEYVRVLSCWNHVNWIWYSQSTSSTEYRSILELKKFQQIHKFPLCHSGRTVNLATLSLTLDKHSSNTIMKTTWFLLILYILID